MSVNATIKIGKVSEYINEIEKLHEDFVKNDSFLLYRGEPVIYPTMGMPGIFRESYLKEDKYFELNILKEMEANHFSKGKNLLELAIDAQHGGFPSRLLDVSYNSLVALYFAVVSVPERKDKEDKEDGHVLIYNIEKTYCPTANNVVTKFDKIVNDPEDMTNSNIFCSNFKLVDHYKMNERISAQQGAFILFPGKEWTPISRRQYREIVIPHEKKKDIEKDLEKCFGISTSFIYPEIMNSIDTIKKKAKYIVNDEFTIENEILLSFENMRKDVSFELNEISRINDISEKIEAVMVLEKKIALKRDDYVAFVKRFCVDMDNTKKGESAKIESIIKNNYEKFCNDYSALFSIIIKGEIESCEKALRWEAYNGM